VDVLEDLDQWYAEYQSGWLAHFKETGETDFSIYNRPRNSVAPSGPGISLAKSRLILITSAGSYLADSQTPFNATDSLGDYTLRLYPSSTPLDKLAFAQDHYNHAAVEEDAQVLVPLRHLEDLVQEGVIGELAPTVISFHGYQPDVTRLIKETIPVILEAVQKEKAHAALLIPA
jgi:D-proline reductase (dithiol) PrdB